MRAGETPTSSRWSPACAGKSAARASAGPSLIPVLPFQHLLSTAMLRAARRPLPGVAERRPPPLQFLSLRPSAAGEPAPRVRGGGDSLRVRLCRPRVLLLWTAVAQAGLL